MPKIAFKDSQNNNLCAILSDLQGLKDRVIILCHGFTTSKSSSSNIALEEILNKDKSRLNKYIKDYNDKIREISKEQGVELIDINQAYLANDYKKLFDEDGLHPNDKGHELIFSLVRDNLLKLFS